MIGWYPLERSGEWSAWHFLVIEDDGVKEPLLYHPDFCNLTVTTVPNEPNVEYLCPIAEEARQAGYDLFFDHHPANEEDGLPPVGTMWMLRCRYYQHTGGPWGPSEWDEEAEVVEIKRVVE